jgi:mono/diheme cytochrome c family protein
MSVSGRTFIHRATNVLVLLVAALLFASCDDTLKQPKAPSPDDLIQRGATLYTANCLSCHGGASGGKLRDIPPPHNANGHTWHHADQQLTDMILNGIPFSLEAQRMPAFKDKLTEEDVKAILASIKTWWTEEQRAGQRRVTEQWDR